MGDYPYSWWELYRVKIVLWYIWGALTPLILHLGTRCHLERPIRFGRIWSLIGASLVITLVYLLVYADLLILNITGRVVTDSYWAMFRFVISRHSTFYYLAFWALIGLDHAVAYYRRLHEREIQASQLETMLAQAQLSALRSRLQPHFLFNSLHSVVALIRSKRSDDATAMVTGLSDLLRQSLEHMDRNEVSLEEELQLLRKYIAIEQMRFSDRLTFEEDIAEDTRAAKVPSFILQPLVENAIRHGIEKQVGAGRIIVRSNRDEDSRIRLEILDNGPGPNRAKGIDGKGVGLEATRERLQRMYHGAFQLELTSGSGGGTTTTVSFPLRFAGGETA